MEVVSIERSTYEELLTSFNSFVTKMKEKFAYPCIIAAPYQGALNPRLAFILGRIALIFQNRFLFTSFFRNFLLLEQEVTPSRNKK